MRLALIDGSNIYQACRSINLKMDYDKLRRLLDEDGQLLRAYYFTALQDKKIDSPLRKTVDWLSHNGYNCVTKETQQFPETSHHWCSECKHHDVETKMRVKGNVDIDIASYAFTFASQVSEIWLFSGDGDFKIMVKTLQEHFRVKVYVVSAMRIVSTELRKQADKYIDLEDLREDVQREERDTAA